jgi:hypothetical protein
VDDLAKAGVAAKIIDTIRPMVMVGAATAAAEKPAAEPKAAAAKTKTAKVAAAKAASGKLVNLNTAIKEGEFSKIKDLITVQ